MLLSNLNEKQKEAVLAETKRLLVLAGAGSGKTKTLIQKLLYLLSEKATKPSSILAITFTKNATNARARSAGKGKKIMRIKATAKYMAVHLS